MNKAKEYLNTKINGKDYTGEFYDPTCNVCRNEITTETIHKALEIAYLEGLIQKNYDNYEDWINKDYKDINEVWDKLHKLTGEK